MGPGRVGVAVAVAAILTVMGPGAGARVSTATTTTTVAAGGARRSSDELMRAVIDDVQAFWASELPAVYGKAYDPVPASRLFPYSAADPPPACGGTGTTPYEDVAGNAFYCSLGDFLAWDTDKLIEKVRADYGDFAVALVAAHELGHAVQERTGTNAGSTIPLELQADCFTGAWVAHATKTTSDAFNLSSKDLEQALSGFLFFRDPAGTDPRQEGAHGSAFDRISAFVDGFDGGVARCKGYTTDPPTITEVPYTSASDAANEGNLPFADILSVSKRDLNAYWKSIAGTTPVVSLVDSAAKVHKCGGGDDRPVAACANGVVAYARVALQKVYDKYGDFAVATLLAEAWADAARASGRVRAARAPDRRSAECLAGAFAADLANGATAGSSTLSPGDLDEAVSVLLGFEGAATSGNSAFVRYEAFRTGFTDGAASCGLTTGKTG